jgi:hypothetical protein
MKSKADNYVNLFQNPTLLLMCLDWSSLVGEGKTASFVKLHTPKKVVDGAAQF